jgi:hypothetical protein
MIEAPTGVAAAQAAITGRGLSPACQRRPQLKHVYILVPSTSATWRLSRADGIVVLPDQALELLIQQD